MTLFFVGRMPRMILGLCFLLSANLASAVIVDLPVGDESGPAFKQVSGGEVEERNALIQSRITNATKFPYWKHVGTVGMGSGLYLGDGYVLTSAHVGCFPFRLDDGSYYKPDYSTWTVLEDNSGGRSDLAIFRVSFPEDSALARLETVAVTATVPDPGTPVLMFGSGRSQKEDPSVLRSNGQILAVLGYRVGIKRSMTWGFNTLSFVPGNLVSLNGYETRCFVTEFNRSDFEAQASEGDSGGASFIFNPILKRWELAGCIIAVTQKGTFVPFGSRTYLANLALYRSQFPVDNSLNDEEITETTQSDSGDSISPGTLASTDSSEGDHLRPAVIAVMIPD